MLTFIFQWIPDRQSQVFLFSLNILLNSLLLSKMWRPFYVDLNILFSNLFKLKRIVFPHSTFDYLYIMSSCLHWQIKNISTKAAVGFYRAVISSVSPARGVCEAQQSLSLWLVYYSTPAQRVSVSASDPEWLLDPQSNIYKSSVVCVKAWQYKVMYF